MFRRRRRESIKKTASHLVAVLTAMRIILLRISLNFYAHLFRDVMDVLGTLIEYKSRVTQEIFNALMFHRITMGSSYNQAFFEYSVKI